MQRPCQSVVRSACRRYLPTSDPAQATRVAARSSLLTCRCQVQRRQLCASALAASTLPFPSPTMPGTTTHTANGTLHGSKALTLKKALLLVSDLDDTMVGHSAPQQLDLSTATIRELFYQNKPKCRLVYNTGRTLPEYEMLWREKQHCMAIPDAMIGGVGSEIFYPTSEGWQEDQEWKAHISQEWEVQVVRQAIAELQRGFGHDNVLHHAGPQQTCHKQTIHVSCNIHTQVFSMLDKMLTSNGVRYFAVQGDDANRTWHFMDILPARAGKGAATRYIQQKLGMPDEHVVACGDSFNDVDMLHSAPQAVLVGNAPQQVHHWAMIQQRLQQQYHQANGRPPAQRLYVANQHASQGILEGLEVLGFV